MIRYRADVDGLRGVAILLVMLFHAGVPGFSGGFVGVDVFFVISGFLITSWISDELGAGTFTFRRFYERRARRILPALLAMLAVTSVLATVVLWPAALLLFARDALANLAFASNIVEWQVTNYFNAQGTEVPLLHTWSLGVEEQFYLAYPAALWLLYRVLSPRRDDERFGTPIGVLAAVTIASALAGVIVTRDRHVQAAFYLLPFRAWQLTAGGLLSLSRIRRLPPGRISEISGWVAVAGLAWICVGYGSDLPYPGLAAIPPTLCAVVLIAGAEGGSVSSILRSAWLVRIGLLSYSLYLWHWPFLVFARQFDGLLPPALLSAIALAIAAAAATLSWRYVERPFRSGAQAAPFSRLAWWSVGAASLVVVLALVARRTNGLEMRFPQPVRAQLRENRLEKEQAKVRCRGGAIEGLTSGGICALGDTSSATIDFAVMGDSHAAALYPVLSRLAFERRLRGALIWNSACPPVLGGRTVVDDKTHGCERLRKAGIQYISDRDVPVVLFAARWTNYLYPPDRRSDGRWLNSDPVSETSIEDRLGQLIARYRSERRRVVLLGDVPAYGFDVPHRVARATLFGEAPAALLGEASVVLAPAGFAMRRLSVIAGANDAQIIDLTPAFCSKAACTFADSAGSLYRDPHHLSNRGAMRLHTLLDSTLAALVSR